MSVAGQYIHMGSYSLSNGSVDCGGRGVAATVWARARQAFHSRKKLCGRLRGLEDNDRHTAVVDVQSQGLSHFDRRDTDFGIDHYHADGGAEEHEGGFRL